MTKKNIIKAEALFDKLWTEYKLLPGDAQTIFVALVLSNWSVGGDLAPYFNTFLKQYKKSAIRRKPDEVTLLRRIEFAQDKAAGLGVTRIARKRKTTPAVVRGVLRRAK